MKTEKKKLRSDEYLDKYGRIHRFRRIDEFAEFVEKQRIKKRINF